MAFLVALLLYAGIDGNWWIFVLLLFVPDISMLGYVMNARAGAVIYNIFHSYVLPLLMLLSSWIVMHSLILDLGLIWIAHIGMDRFFGFGLKETTGFKDTHLGRIGP